MGMFALVAPAIEKVEGHILRWMRLLTVVVIAVMLVIGALLLLISTAMVAQSTDVSVGAVEPATFAQPGIRNEEDDPATRAEEPDEPENAHPIRRDYGEAIDDVVGTLHPLYVATEFSISTKAITDYTVGVIEEIQSEVAKGALIVGEEPDEIDSIVESYTDDAVSGLVDYAEDLVDYYGDEIDMDTSGAVAKRGKELVPAFKENLDDVLERPLAGYKSTYLDALNAAFRAALEAADEGEKAVKTGQAGFAFLMPVGAVLLVLLFLLLLFKIEIRLQDGGVPDAATEEKQTFAE